MEMLIIWQQRCRVSFPKASIAILLMNLSKEEYLRELNIIIIIIKFSFIWRRNIPSDTNAEGIYKLS